jgi:serine-type D-Ala-D-Ala carboxypeptidase/endopeptidase (penicillin-binding protein 4)
MPAPSLCALSVPFLRAFALKKFLAVALLLAAAACAPLAGPARAPAAGAPLTAELDAIFADTAMAHAHWGVFVRSLETGRVLYSRNAERLFVPASNAKLWTGAAALEVLGPEYRYHTHLLAAGPVRNGVLQGDLVVVGSGDPTISARFHGGEPRAVFRAWADSLRARGVTRVAGAILAIDTVFARVPWGPGWAWDDLDAGYAAEVGGLNFNDGIADVRVFPGGAPGQPAVIALDPPTSYAGVVSEVTTGAPGSPARLAVSRDAVTPVLTFRGSVAADTSALARTVAVRGVSQYFTAVLRETLREQGILVEGPPLDGLEWPERVADAARATPLFVHRSPPLREIVPAYMKPSQNQIAETLLRTLGREARGAGTSAAGIAVVDSVMRLWQVGHHPRRLADGSGLSRYNLASPLFFADLNTVMAQGPHAGLWADAQPLAGVDGTLAGRLRGTAAEGRVQAKTGTLSGVRALSGYLTTQAGERLVFSIIANHHTRPAATADRVVDAALVRLVAEPRR